MTIGYISSNVRWLVEFYPFSSPIPDSTISPISAPASIIASIKSDADDLKAELVKSKLVSKDSNLIKGLKRISLTRSKASPSSKCSMAFVGPLPDSVYVGVWTVVTSLGRGKNLVRFVGQIESIDCSYQVTDEGLLSQQSMVVVREWSSMLEYAVRFDKVSLSNETSKNSVGAAATAANLLAQAKADTLNTINDVIAKAYDPLELAQNILSLVGAMNEQDVVQPLQVAGVNLNRIAMTMPEVPQSVIARLRTTTPAQALSKAITPITASNPYASGFINVATGTLTTKIHTDDKWDGIFESGGMDEIKSKMKEGYNNNSFRPLSQGLGAVIQSQESVWKMISTTCDPLVYEFYTDIWYEEDASGKIICKPTIVLRDKPAALDLVAKEHGDNYENIKKFTLYDNIPRITINSASIMSLRINNNLLNSPNYFVINYNTEALKTGLNTATATEKSRKRIEPEMRRFGGHDFNGTAMFLGNVREQNRAQGLGLPEASIGVEEYLGVLSDLMVVSNAYDYRMASGVLTIKDDNYAISIGWNVTFQFGDRILCGHVDAVGLDFYIDETGLEVSNMNLTLSRMVELQKGSAGSLTSSAGLSVLAAASGAASGSIFSTDTLTPMSPEVWGNLFRKNQ